MHSHEFKFDKKEWLTELSWISQLLFVNSFWGSRLVKYWSAYDLWVIFVNISLPERWEAVSEHFVQYFECVFVISAATRQYFNKYSQFTLERALIAIINNTILIMSWPSFSSNSSSVMLKISQNMI